MRSIRLKFYLWVGVWVAIFVAANFRLRDFPHYVLIFWTLLPITSVGLLFFMRKSVRMLARPTHLEGEREEPLPFEISISNLSPFTKLEVFSEDGYQIDVDPKRRSSLSYIAVAPHIGLYRAPKSTLYVSDPMGFFTFYWDVDLPQMLSLPRTVDREIQVGTIAGDFEVSQDPKTALKEHSVPLIVTDRRVGESLRRAHWKISARVQKWMIRRADREPERMVHIVLDLPNVDYDENYQIVGTESAEDESKFSFRSKRKRKDAQDSLDAHAYHASEQDFQWSKEERLILRDQIVEDVLGSMETLLEMGYSITLMTNGETKVLHRHRTNRNMLISLLANLPFASNLNDQSDEQTAVTGRQWEELRQANTVFWFASDLEEVKDIAMSRFLPMHNYRTIVLPKTDPNVAFVEEHPALLKHIEWISYEKQTQDRWNHTESRGDRYE